MQQQVHPLNQEIAEHSKTFNTKYLKTTCKINVQYIRNNSTTTIKEYCVIFPWISPFKDVSNFILKLGLLHSYFI